MEGFNGVVPPPQTFIAVKSVSADDEGLFISIVKVLTRIGQIALIPIAIFCFAYLLVAIWLFRVLRGYRSISSGRNGKSVVCADDKISSISPCIWGNLKSSGMKAMNTAEELELTAKVFSAIENSGGKLARHD